MSVDRLIKYSMEDFMKAIYSVVATVLAVLILGSGAVLAQNRGDVTIKLNGGGSENKIYVNQDNTLQFYVKNSGALKGMSLGFAFSSTVGPVTFVTPYGTKPAGTPYLAEHNDAVGKFDLGGLQVTITSMPDSVLIGGAALNLPLPAHASSTLLYSMKVRVLSDTVTTPQAFCVDNILFPPAGKWIFDEGSPIGKYAPTFQGVANTSPEEPDAPAVCFDVVYVSYVPGDANGDRYVDISDIVFLIAYIFEAGPAPNPLQAGNANCRGVIDISDIVFILAFVFGGGPAPCTV